jgi:uncharacterized membrane protein YphA (DoxX/SURF4 family)
MFSSFPGGAPGLGLLLLRLVLGAGAILQGTRFLGVGAPWFGAFAIANGTLLLIGLMTPIASALIGLGALDIAFSQSRWTPLAGVIHAIAIALLGPGAMSIDARLFGRREIIIPPKTSRPSDSDTNQPSSSD